MNAIPCLKPDEAGFMFDCCSVRFSNVRLCSIGRILWLCSNVKILGWVWLSSIEVNRTIEVRLPIFRLVTLSNVVWGEKKADTNAEKDRANRGHAQLKPSLPSFSLYSKVLMSITLLRFIFQNATKFGNYLLERARKNFLRETIDSANKPENKSSTSQEAAFSGAIPKRRPTTIKRAPNKSPWECE